MEDRVTPMNTKTRPMDKPWSSKNNRIYAAIFILAGLANPAVYDWINQFFQNSHLGFTIPATLIAICIQLMTVIGYIVRTYYTNINPGPLPEDPNIPKPTGPDTHDGYQVVYGKPEPKVEP